MNFARLNHIFIPPTKDERDRLRSSRFAKLGAPFFWLGSALSPEGRSLSIMLMLIGMAGLDVDRSEVYLLFCALFGALFASLFARPLFRVRGLAVHVDAAHRVAVGAPMSFDVKLINATDRDFAAVRVVRPFLPWDGAWKGPRGGVALVPARGSARFVAAATFSARGEHHIDAFYAAELVPLGLALGPGVLGLGTRFLVVPQVANVARVALPEARPLQSGGAAKMMNAGDAMDLKGVRPYRPGDAIRMLHARTWARSGIPHVREYQDEHLMRAGVVIDLSDDEATEGLTEAVLSLAAGVVTYLLEGSVRIDVLVHDVDPSLIPLGRGERAADALLDRLAVARPGGAFSVESALSPLGGSHHGLCWLVLITTRPDASRKELVARITPSGASAHVVLVTPEKGPLRGEAPLGWVTVGAAAIASGEPIAC